MSSKYQKEAIDFFSVKESQVSLENQNIDSNVDGNFDNIHVENTNVDRLVAQNSEIFFWYDVIL